LNGIDRVEFSVEGGDWVSVSEMTLNLRTGVMEYWVPLDASLFTGNSLVEIRARIFPKNAGGVRVLQGPINSFDYASRDGGMYSLWLNVNKDPLNNPIVEEVIELAPGETTLNSIVGGDTTWKVIRPLPGGDNSNTFFRTSGLSKWVKLENLTLLGGISHNDPGDLAWGVWIDNCISQGPGRSVLSTAYDSEFPSGGHQPQNRFWETNSIVQDFLWVGHSSTFMQLQRGNLYQRILAVFQNNGLIVNSEVYDQGDLPGDPIIGYLFEYESDPRGHDNYITYGLRVTHYRGRGIALSQGLSPHSLLSNFAFVNLALARRPWLSHDDGTATSDWGNVDIDHLLFYHITMERQVFNANSIGGDGLPVLVNNFSMKGCSWDRWAGNSFDESFSEHNHFTNLTGGSGGNTIGSDASTGDPGFVDSLNYDLHPAPGSILLDRIPNPVVPIDLDGFERIAPASVGAYEP